MKEDHKETVRRQFDGQAERFDRWSVTRNEDYLRRYCDFIGLLRDDRLLDVACGTGRLCLHAAPRVSGAVGVDLSGEMVVLAGEEAVGRGVRNVLFLSHDVERLPFRPNSFSVAVCKSALHHMAAPEKVFREMVRACRRDGRISLQDIVAYGDRSVNRFFEELEQTVDGSHHRTLGRDEVLALYRESGIPVVRTAVVEVDLHLGEYLDHADQASEARDRVLAMVAAGRRDRKIAGIFFERGEGLFFRREVLLALGVKPGPHRGLQRQVDRARSFTRPSDSVVPDAQDREILKSLGYIH